MGWQRPPVRLDNNNRAFWTGGREGKLLINQCGDCGGFIHPPRDICCHCLSDNVQPQPVAGTGTIDSFTVNHQKWSPDMEVPFVIARVRLDDAPGVILTTNIVNGPADAVEMDDPVRVLFEEQHGIWYPLFERAA